MGIWDVGPFDNNVARDVVADLRAGRFSFTRFRFDCSGENLDADDALVVIALSALATAEEDELPDGLTPNHVKALTTPAARSWLRDKYAHIMAPETSPLYALWEETGELESWKKEALAVKPAPWPRYSKRPG